MKKYSIYLAVLVTALIIQSSFFPPLFSFRPLPQLVLVIIISWTVIAGFRSAFWRAVLAGFLFDIAFGQKIGTEILILAVISYLVSFFSRRFLVENKFWGGLVLVGFVIGATVLHRFYGEFMYLAGAGCQIREIFRVIFSNAAGSWLREIFSNVILFGLCFWALKKIESRFISSSQ